MMVLVWFARAVLCSTKDAVYEETGFARPYDLIWCGIVV